MVQKCTIEGYDERHTPISLDTLVKVDINITIDEQIIATSTTLIV